MRELIECHTDLDGYIIYEKDSDGTERWYVKNNIFAFKGPDGIYYYCSKVG